MTSGREVSVRLARSGLIVVTLLTAVTCVASGDSSQSVTDPPVAGWTQLYLLDVVVGANPLVEPTDFYVSAQVLGIRTSASRSLGYGSSVVEILSPGSDMSDTRYAVLPVYGYFVPHLSCKGESMAGNPLVHTMIQLYLGGSPLAFANVEDDENDPDGASSGIDWWWHWYVRSGIRASLQTSGARAWGLDLGVELFDSESDPSGVGWCAYAGVSFTFGATAAEGGAEQS